MGTIFLGQVTTQTASEEQLDLFLPQGQHDVLPELVEGSFELSGGRA
jgi:hypothetical protein